MTLIRRRYKRRRPDDSGYMLLFLLLAVAMLTITMLGVARNYKREVQREREVEMIHRGEQYERAVQRFYRKNKAYPASIEQLEKTNNIRYLRKRYKDPMSLDGTWKIAHDTDILSLTLKSGVGLTGTAGSASGSSTASTASAQTASTDAGSSASGTGQSTDTSTATATTATTTGGTGLLGQGNNATTSGQVFGGGAMVGVVSKSVAQGIHIFGDKSKYNEWFFIYDPRQDTGKSLLVGPYDPKKFVGTFSTGPVNTNTGANGPQTPNTGAPGTVAPTATTPTTPSTTTP